MSEQEKKSGGTAAGGSSVVMVESAASRQKQPYRPTELQESPTELHHKRSKAPAVPSVAEELKEATESAEAKERKESDRAISSEKTKHSIAKKLSSNTKRRGPSPEAITLAPLEVEMKKGTISPPPQPIPPQVASVASADDLTIAKAGSEKKTDDDSITDEITELRTPEVAKRSSEWQNNKEFDDKKNVHSSDQDIRIDDQIEQQEEFKDILPTLKKKEISWNDKGYIENIHLQELGVRSQASMLERKASIGPCFRQGTPFGGPSGITICLPKKSLKNIDEDLRTLRSVISITVSKKCLINKSTSRIDNELGENHTGQEEIHENSKLKVNNVPSVKCLGFLRGKISSVRGKIRNVLNM